jgi:hypothetical protein
VEVKMSVPYGTSNGKKRYAGNNPECSHKTWYTEYRYNGCKPEVKRAILKWAIDRSGIGATAGEWGMDLTPVGRHC